MRPRILICLLALFACRSPSPETRAVVTGGPTPRANTTAFSHASGGSMRLNMGYGIALNERTSIQREWIAAHDSTAPVDLVGTPGLATAYGDGYQARASYQLQVRDSVVAVEIRFVAFDVWGDPIRTFRAAEIEDLGRGLSREYKGTWSLSSYGADPSELYATIAYVSRVRRANGAIWEANEAPILAEARRFDARFTPEDLLPPGGRRTQDSSTVGSAHT